MRAIVIIVPVVLACSIVSSRSTTLYNITGLFALCAAIMTVTLPSCIQPDRTKSRIIQVGYSLELYILIISLYVGILLLAVVASLPLHDQIFR